MSPRQEKVSRSHASASKVLGLAASQELACVLYFVGIDVAVTPINQELLEVVAGLGGLSPLLEEASQLVVAASELCGLKDACRPGISDVTELALRIG